MSVYGAGVTRRTILWTAAALLGIAVTAAVAWAASQLAGQRIGLVSAPLSVQRGLAPSEPHSKPSAPAAGRHHRVRHRIEAPRRGPTARGAVVRAVPPPSTSSPATVSSPPPVTGQSPPPRNPPTSPPPRAPTTQSITGTNPPPARPGGGGDDSGSGSANGGASSGGGSSTGGSS